MATALLGTPNETAQSLFKHELLSRYLVTFVNAGSGGRVRLLDGAAGSGRHQDGSPATAERLLQSVRRLEGCDAIFIERSPARFRTLTEVVASYPDVDGVALQGVVQDHLEEIGAEGAPMLCFLDPQGVGFDSLTRLLAVSRGGGATEVLVDFTPAQVSRALRSPARGEAMDAACGGPWWRHTAAAGRDLRSATRSIATEYARRLSDTTGTSSVTLPVYRRLGHRPIQHLVFATRSEYGLWTFAHTAARTRQAWLRRLGALGDQRDGLTLISDTTMKDDLIRQEELASRTIITQNVRELVERLPRFKLANETRAVLGTAYGVATEGVIREVVTGLQLTGELHIGQNNKPPPARTRTRDLMVFAPR